MNGFWRIIAPLAALALIGSPAIADVPDVEYYEAPVITWDGQPKSTQSPRQLTFRAFGQTFDLHLEDNDRLLQGLGETKSSEAKQDAWHARGQLSKVPNSWVRISRVGDDYFGAIWDGSSLYLIDPGWAIGAPDVPLVVYRADAVRRPGVTDEVLAPPTVNRKAPPEPFKLALAGKAASQRLNVSIVTDAEFTSQNSSAPVAAVMARMNVVDGIYSEQVRVQLYVSHVEVLNNNGPLTSTAHSTLLDQFVNYYRDSSLAQPGLAHLFSGKNFNGSTVGVAYLGVLCSSFYGYGISEVRGSGSSGALIVAHEIGHNFDAPHDNAAECDDDPFRGIMNSSLNGSTQFSQCSLGFMAQEVSRSSCLTGIDQIFNGNFE